LLRLLDGVRDLDQLRHLARSDVPELEADVGDVLRPLISAGAVVDARVLHVRWPPQRLALHHDGGSRLHARTIGHVLTGVGIGALDAADPDLLVVVSCGEPARTVFGEAQRRGIAHLMVVLDEDRVRVGPFVAPGITPCLGCLDLHRAEWDPAWPALLPQLGRASWAMTTPVVAAPLRHVAAAEVGVEVLAIAAGSRPRTAGRVLALGPEHDARTSWQVAFHHGCACALLPAA
jgi:hypothetical protein